LYLCKWSTASVILINVFCNQSIIQCNGIISELISGTYLSCKIYLEILKSRIPLLLFEHQYQIRDSLFNQEIGVKTNELCFRALIPAYNIVLHIQFESFYCNKDYHCKLWSKRITPCVMYIKNCACVDYLFMD